MLEVELIFINTCKDLVKSGDASLKQYIFFKLAFILCQNIDYRPDSMRLNAQRLVLFAFKQKENFHKMHMIDDF